MISYLAAFDKAKEVFQQRSSEGRNEFIPPVAMFPFGASSHGTIIYMKTMRFIGNIMTGNLTKATEEAEDLLNYLAMFLAWRVVNNIDEFHAANPEAAAEAISKIFSEHKARNISAAGTDGEEDIIAMYLRSR